MCRIIQYVDLQGRSALHHAVDGFGVLKEVVKLLFEAGAAVGTPDNDPISSLSPESFGHFHIDAFSLSVTRVDETGNSF
jgi:hypothetical protein